MCLPSAWHVKAEYRMGLTGAVLWIPPPILCPVANLWRRVVYLLVRRASLL